MAQSKEVVPNFADRVLKEITQLRDERRFFDIHFILDAHQRRIGAHRLVLIATSGYFRKLFEREEGVENEICVKDIDGDIFQILIDFCYTGAIEVNEHNFRKLLSAAIVLELKDGIRICTEYCRNQMVSFNILWSKVLKIAEELNLESLRNDVLQFVIENFAKINNNNDELLDINVEVFGRILESDELNVLSEEMAFHVVKRWYDHDTDGRSEKLVELISRLRVTQLKPAFILEYIHPLPGCAELALAALNWIHLPTSREQTMLSHTKARRSLSILDNKNTISSNDPNLSWVAMPIGTGRHEISQFDPENYKWKLKAALILKNHYSKVVYTNKSELVFIGDSLRSYNVFTGNWTTLSTQHSPIGLSIVEFEGNIYTIGVAGEGEEEFSSVKSFNKETGKWSVLSAMCTARSHAAAIVFDGKIFVTGGSSSEKPWLKSTEYYNPVTNNWHQLADMQNARSDHEAVVAKGKIYALGGRLYSFYSVNSVECYDPVQNTWSLTRPLSNEGRGKIRGASINNRLIIMNCQVESNKWIMEEYDFERNFWIRTGHFCLGNYKLDIITIPTSIASKLEGIITEV